MSKWRPLNRDAYYFLVDSKPAEVVDISKPNTIFCTAFVDTASSVLGVKNADLPWLKQYKECDSLLESIDVVTRLTQEIQNNSFHDLFVFVMSSTFASIDQNGMEFLLGAEKEVEDFNIKGTKVVYQGAKYDIQKAKMLMWYNFCLCNLATRLTDKTLKYGKKEGVFLIDRLSDSDKRIFKFMEMVTKGTSLFSLWKRCAEDHKIKPDRIGFEFTAEYSEDGKLVPVKDAMQDSLVDWIVLAAYAHRNGQENRDEKFQRLLENLIQVLITRKQINGIHFKGKMTWN